MRSTFRQCTGARLSEVMLALAIGKIDPQRWWESACHREPAFTARPAQPMPTTDFFVNHAIGLPFFLDISDEDIGRVTDALRQFIDTLVPPGYAPCPAADKGATSFGDGARPSWAP